MSVAVIVAMLAGALASSGLGQARRGAAENLVTLRQAPAPDIGKPDVMAAVAAQGAPFRLPAGADMRLEGRNPSGIELLQSRDWRLTAGFASIRPARELDRLNTIAGGRPHDVRTAKGLRIAAELISGGSASGQSVALEARLQHVRIQDTSLTDAGEKLGDARLTLVFKRSW